MLKAFGMWATSRVGVLTHGHVEKEVFLGRSYTDLHSGRCGVPCFFCHQS